MKKTQKGLSLLSVLLPVLLLGYSPIIQAATALVDGVYDSQIGDLSGKAILVGKQVYGLLHQAQGEASTVYTINFDYNFLAVETRSWDKKVPNNSKELVNGDTTKAVVSESFYNNNELQQGFFINQKSHLRNIRSTSYKLPTQASGSDTPNLIRAVVCYDWQNRKCFVERPLSLAYNKSATTIGATPEALVGRYFLDKGLNKSVNGVNGNGENTDAAFDNVGISIDEKGAVQLVQGVLPAGILTPTKMEKEYQALAQALNGLKSIVPLNQDKGPKNIYLIKNPATNNVIGAATIAYEGKTKKLEMMFLNSFGRYTTAKFVASKLALKAEDTDLSAIDLSAFMRSGEK